MLFTEFWRTVRQAIAHDSQTVRLLAILFAGGFMVLAVTLVVAMVMQITGA